MVWKSPKGWMFACLMTSCLTRLFVLGAVPGNILGKRRRVAIVPTWMAKGLQTEAAAITAK
jgi:hypothetical protein